MNHDYPPNNSFFHILDTFSCFSLSLDRRIGGIKLPKTAKVSEHVLRLESNNY